MFTRSHGDASTADDGGTVIVARDGTRWRRNYRGPLNPLWFAPVDRNGSTDDGIAIRAALAIGATQLPHGTFNVLTTITIPTRRRFTGLGVQESIINSNIPGGSLFEASRNGVSFAYVGHMRINGNGLRGAGGSGHCFNFIDPSPHAGSATPQNSQLEDLWIDGFQGSDDADEQRSRKVASAGIMQYGTLAVTCRNVYVSDCGNGFYFRRTQNCRLLNSVATDMLKAGVFAYDNENLLVDGCDLLDCGKDNGSTDAGYPVADPDLMGVFVAYLNNNLTLSNSKLKGFRGKALIVIKGNGQNINIKNNWIRGDAQSAIPHKAIYAERIAGLNIKDNLFTPSNTGFSATQKYETIELYNPSDTPAFESTVEGNTFLDPSGFRVAYHIAVRGNGGTRTHRITIRNNRFGSNSSRAGQCIIDTDILLSNCTLDSCSIAENSHCASKNVTRTSGVTAHGVTLRRVRIGPSQFQESGGAISADYTGITESVLTTTIDLASSSALREGEGRAERLRVRGAEPGDFVQVSFNQVPEGVVATGIASEADSVAVRLVNQTGRTLSRVNGKVTIRVTKAWAA